MSVRDVMWDFGRWLQKKSYPNPKIEFYSPVEGIEQWAPPVPAAKMVPQWYKDLAKIYEPNNLPENRTDGTSKVLPTGNPPEWRVTGETVKTCPGMQDIMTSGYVVPMWGSILIETTEDGYGAGSITSSAQAAYANGDNADYMKVRADESVGSEMMRYIRGMGFTEEETLQWKNFQTTNLGQYWDVHTHPAHQYNTLQKTMPEEYCKAVIKVVSPWRIKTPPGFSTMILPCPYEYNHFEVLPGIINTDVYNTFNMFMIMKAKGSKFMIPFREKMCVWMPFPRYNLPHEVRSANLEDLAEERRQVNAVNSNFGSSRQYRMLGKLLDKKTGGKCPFN